ncbi:hypothetical protein HDV05_007361, partial [Chytridiales sp. JEL 0842]
AAGARLIILPQPWLEELKNHISPISAQSLSFLDLYIVQIGNIKVIAELEDVATIFGTSGTTGVPKLVMQTKRSQAILIDWHMKRIGITGSDTVVMSGASCFDVWTLGVCTAITSGASVYQIPDDFIWESQLPNTLNSVNATMLHALPIHGNLILSDWQTLVQNGLKMVLMIGDRLGAIPNFDPSKLKVINMYGPTETTIYNTFEDVEPGELQPCIGKPVDGHLVAVVNSNGIVLPPGMIGEIVIGGHGTLSKGYFGRPDLNQARFRDLRLPDGRSEKVYYTSDLGYVRHDGRFVFIDRMTDDGLVKVNGAFVDMVAVKNVISAFDGVLNVHVFAVEGLNSTNAIAAVIQVSSQLLSQGQQTLLNIRKTISLKLPAFAIPKTIKLVNDIPMNKNGKFDVNILKQQLKQPASPQTERKLVMSNENHLSLETKSTIGPRVRRLADALSKIKVTSEVHITSLKDVKTVVDMSCTSSGMMDHSGKKRNDMLIEILIDEESVSKKRRRRNDANRKEVDLEVDLVGNGGSATAFSDALQRNGKEMSPGYIVKQNSLSGVVCIVTGASAGIGYATARSLFIGGAHVICACRNKSKALAAIENMNSEASEMSSNATAAGKLDFMYLDTANLNTVRQFAKEFLERNLPLHLLINNAGIASFTSLPPSVDGFELQFATNHLGHFLLTNLLLPVLKATAESLSATNPVPLKSVSIVNVSALAHHILVQRPDWSSQAKTETSPSGFSGYAVSKLANVCFTVELARRLRETHGISSDKIQTCSLHPGGVASDIWDRLLPSSLASLVKRVMISSEQGSSTSLYCALDDNVLGDVEAGYYEDCRLAKRGRFTFDKDYNRELWERSEEWTGLSTTKSML